jgi:hypothetical protein
MYSDFSAIVNSVAGSKAELKADKLSHIEKALDSKSMKLDQAMRELEVMVGGKLKRYELGSIRSHVSMKMFNKK